MTEQGAALEALADILIPSDGRMPAYSSVDPGARKAIAVIEAQPAGSTKLRAVCARAEALNYDQALLEILPQEDAEAWTVVLLGVASTYYEHAEVRELIDYQGQKPSLVDMNDYADLLESGLLDPVVARGQRYRPIPDHSVKTEEA